MGRGFGALRRRLGRKLLEASFDPAWYRVQYLNDSNEPPFQHYLRIGRSEGRSPNADFDEVFYRQRYPDVVQPIADGYLISGFDHFLRYGRREGRLPRADHVCWANRSRKIVSLRATVLQ